MKFSTAAITALGLISSVHAGPIASKPVPRSDSMSVVYEEHMTIKGVEGTFQAFLDKSLPIASNETSALNKRCGSNQIHCDYTYNRAITGICGLLMDALGGDAGLSASQYTSLCFTATNLANNNMCCVSWQETIPGLKRGHLLSAATSTFSCSQNELVSGWAGDVSLNGVCTVQCLTNQVSCWN